MPPIYTWIDSKTKAEVQVIRSVKDIEQAPTKEESGIEPTKAQWKRKVCASRFIRGPSWGTGRKGYW